MRKYLIISLLMVTFFACTSEKVDQAIDEDKLGFIDADVESEETNLKMKAKYADNIPGTAVKIERAFENAPPMIPHTVEGFLPIKIKNNICLSCHMPDKAEEVKAIPLPETHFTELRPELVNKGDVYEMVAEDKLTVNKTDKFSNAYFHCTQCHAPQTDVTVDIQNLFTPDFREEFSIEKSNLIENISEGVK